MDAFLLLATLGVGEERVVPLADDPERWTALVTLDDGDLLLTCGPGGKMMVVRRSVETR